MFWDDNRLEAQILRRGWKVKRADLEMFIKTLKREVAMFPLLGRLLLPLCLILPAFKDALPKVPRVPCHIRFSM